MLKSQELQMKLSELRERSNKLAAIEPNMAQLEEIRQELATIEPKYRAALESEASRTAVAFTDGDAEHRERQTVSPERPISASWWERWYHAPGSGSRER